MRIALFSEVYWPMVSGVSMTLLRLVNELQARGHVVRVYSATYPLPDGVPDRPEVFRCPSKPFFLAPDVQSTTIRQEAVTADLADFQPDLVHVLTEWTLGRRGLRAARELDIPIIMSAHTDYERYAASYGIGNWVAPAAWAYLRWFYRFGHKVLAPSRSYERFLNDRGIWHTGIWTRGVDATAFHPRFRSDAFRARYGVGPEGVLVSNIGRLAPEKNIGLLLDAWERLGAAKRGAQLLLVGQGLMEPAIRERALPDVHLLGTQHGADLSTAYASSDVFAFPSVTETFGNALLEAMACGVASVVADKGGQIEFVEPDGTSLVATSSDVESFGASLERLIGDAALRQRLGARARLVAEQRGWSEIYDQLLEDYAGTIAVRRDDALVAA